MALVVIQILTERKEPKDVKNALRERGDISNEKALSASRELESLGDSFPK
jgi:hypothetical protein